MPSNQPLQCHLPRRARWRRDRGHRPTPPGLGTQLMHTSEDAAEHLYRQLGWTPAGTIPGYALDPDGTPHDAVIFYKALHHTGESPAG